MVQQQNRIDEIPLLLTVEEAGELLRIGRTKAYSMTREWRETNGASGLPVIDLGNVLRVPRRALEELIGADLSGEQPTRTRSQGNREPDEAIRQPDPFTDQPNT